MVVFAVCFRLSKVSAECLRLSFEQLSFEKEKKVTDNNLQNNTKADDQQQVEQNSSLGKNKVLR